jgi:hypothetical protein
MLENRRSFKATCSEAAIIDTPNCLYKHVRMFGEKTLIYWKDTGRISTRNGYIIPQTKNNIK